MEASKVGSDFTRRNEEVQEGRGASWSLGWMGSVVGRHSALCYACWVDELKPLRKLTQRGNLLAGVRLRRRGRICWARVIGDSTSRWRAE